MLRSFRQLQKQVSSTNENKDNLSIHIKILCSNLPYLDIFKDKLHVHRTWSVHLYLIWPYMLWPWPWPFDFWPYFIQQVTWLGSSRSEAQAHVCLPVHGAPGECYYNTLLCCDYFSLSSVVSRAFSAVCVYSKFRHHPHPLGYLCAKACYFRDLHCWASPCREIVYSITQSISQLVWRPGNRSACTLENCTTTNDP